MMNIKSITPSTVMVIETEDDTFIRFSNDNWVKLIGNSWEPVYDGTMERSFNLYMKIVGENAAI